MKGNLAGLKGYTVGRMTKSHRGKLYIEDADWGPEAGSMSTGIVSPLAGFMSSSARLVNRKLSRTPAPTSSRRLSARDMPRFKLPRSMSLLALLKEWIWKEDLSTVKRRPSTQAMSRQPARPTPCIKCKMVGWGVVQMETSFRTPTSSQTGLRYSWPVHSR